MKRSKQQLLTVIMVVSLALVAYIAAFRFQHVIIYWSPDWWARHEGEIREFFRPVQAVADRMEYRRHLTMWRDLSGDWEASFPVDSDAKIQIRDMPGDKFSLHAIAAFPFLDDGGNELELKIEGAAAYGNSYSVILYPRGGEIILEAHKLPLDSSLEPATYVFVHKGTKQRTSRGTSTSTRPESEKSFHGS